MRLDPQTTVESLLRAIPSSVLAFDKLGIKTDGNEKKSLQQVCADRGLGLEEFLRELDEIDWEKESLEGEISAFPEQKLAPEDSIQD